MRFPPTYYQIEETLAEHFPRLRPSQIHGLALWVFGLLLVHRGTETAVATALAAFGGSISTLRQRLREWLYDGADKAAPCKVQLDAEACFAPLLAWIVAGWRGDDVPLAVDATNQGKRLVALVVSVLYRGSAVPVAWKLLPARQKGSWLTEIEGLLILLKSSLPSDKTVILMADRGLWSPRLWNAARAVGIHPMIRVQKNILFQPTGGKKGPAARLIEGRGHAWTGAGKAFKEKRLDATLIVLWIPKAKEPCLVLTDLPPSVERIGDYGLRFWIELGFRCLKSVGWDWEKMKRTDPVRSGRHWLAMALATFWAIASGSETEDEETVRSEKPKRKRQVCLFWRGLGRISAQLFNGQFRPPSPLLPDPRPDLSGLLQILVALPIPS